MSTTGNIKGEQEVREPNCPACLAQKGSPVIPRARTRPTHLTKPEQVWKVTGGIHRETVRHAAHKSGLLNTYMLHSKIPCSFPDKTPHKEGLIIQTLCGKTVNVGRDCGKSYVVGMQQVIEYADELAKYRSSQVLIPYAAVAREATA